MIATASPKSRPFNNSNFDTYLSEIDDAQLLDADEELELAERVSEGDCAARDAMARANLRLVVHIARRYTGKGLELDDLIAEGNLGLMRAVEDFDPSLGNRFIVYASYWIKESIRRALSNSSRTIRLPKYVHPLLVKWRSATDLLRGKLGCPPSEEEVGRALGMSAKQMKIIKKALLVGPAIPSAGPRDANHEAAIDGIADRHDADGSDACRREALQEVLGQLDRLDERQATVLRMRFGLGGEEPSTLETIGERLGLTRERVRQIERVALNELRKKLLDE